MQLIGPEYIHNVLNLFYSLFLLPYLPTCALTLQVDHKLLKTMLDDNNGRPGRWLRNTLTPTLHPMNKELETLKGEAIYRISHLLRLQFLRPQQNCQVIKVCE